MSRPKKREEEPDYAQVGIGIAFLVVTLIFAFLVTPLAAWPFLIPAAALLSEPVAKAVRQGRALPKPPDKESELLSALRRSESGMVPAEAAMQTSLTVDEADGMLSGLAGKGHLMVESRDGALFYRLPSRSGERELER